MHTVGFVHGICMASDCGRECVAGLICIQRDWLPSGCGHLLIRISCHSWNQENQRRWNRASLGVVRLSNLPSDIVTVNVFPVQLWIRTAPVHMTSRHRFTLGVGVVKDWSYLWSCATKSQVSSLSLNFLYPFFMETCQQKFRHHFVAPAHDSPRI